MSRVKACLNGARTPGEHPALPITPAELAGAARACRDAGAYAVHMHPRDAGGRESLDAGPVGEAVRAVRAECPGLPIGLSTGAWIEPDPRSRIRQIRSWAPLPDFVSVNLSEAGAAELVRELPAIGIAVEAGLSSVDDARLLVSEELHRSCLRILVEPRSVDGRAAVALAAAIDSVLDEAGVDLERIHHGEGPATWAVIGAARARGWNVRAGLEDSLTLPDGDVARDNADLVLAASVIVGASPRSAESQFR